MAVIRPTFASLAAAELYVMRILLASLLVAVSTAALADEDRVVRLDTRPGVSVSFYYMKRDGAQATVVLLMGGNGAIGLKGGAPRSRNFLVRSRDYFAANGFHVAVADRPTDQPLDYQFRISPEHIHDLRQVVSYLKKDAGLPVWLVGTSRGTVSVAASAIAFGNEEIAGIVLTSSVTSLKRTGAVPGQKLDAIRLPVLVLHHEKDACAVTRPHEVHSIIAGLTHTPVKRQVMVSGGADPEGDPCEALHWHGYIGMEKEAVDIISAWIKNPKP